MSKKILFISLLVVLLTSAISINRAHAKTDPCSSWESWITEIMTSGLRLVFGPKTIETRRITSQDIGRINHRLKLDVSNLGQLKDKFRKLGGRIIDEKGDSFRAKFVREDFRPCPPKGGKPAGEESQINPSGSPNNNPLNIVALIAAIAAILFGISRRRGKGKQAEAYGGD